MNFNCRKCGRCCKHIQYSLANVGRMTEPYRSEFEKFEFEFKKDGSCSLLKNGRCRIYEDRPLICNVSGLYYKYFSDEMTIEEYYKKVKDACKKLK